MEDGSAGSAFVIPSLKTEKSYHLGKGHSIFAAELVAILMALYYVIQLPVTVFNILFCVDSQSVLQSLQIYENRQREDLLFEIKLMIHCLLTKGTNVEFYWIPSHSGFLYNDQADRAAKRGARNSSNSLKLLCPLSYKEICNRIGRDYKERCHVNSKCRSLNLTDFSYVTRPVYGLVCRLLSDSLRTKYCSQVKCICSEDISIHHILLGCDLIRPFLPEDIISRCDMCGDVFEFLQSLPVVSLVELAKSLLCSPISRFL